MYSSCLIIDRTGYDNGLYLLLVTCSRIEVSVKNTCGCLDSAIEIMRNNDLWINI
jgi:hypothetical protein